ncbi:hypothetical protein KAI32_01235 [Candidatus Pacearchaeota archaeon]|nr:hypothetical protein [Candidatus Pacearchaeota archaeon]
MNDFNEPWINAKYHLAVADRMYRGYDEFADKRFLVGVINELARAVSNLIRAFLIYEGFRGKDSLKNMKIFMETVAPKYLDGLTRENLFRTLEIERAQKDSPIEYVKDRKIILLIRGQYRFLTVIRIGEFIESVKKGVMSFPGNFRHI